MLEQEHSSRISNTENFFSEDKNKIAKAFAHIRAKKIGINNFIALKYIIRRF